MANASYRSAGGVWGAKPTATTVRSESYVYHFALNGDNPNLIVGSGNPSVRADIKWTFGAGVLGQTFILENKGRLYDCQMSTFRGLQGETAITPGHKPARPGDLENAIGTKLPPKTAARCFGCHTTTSTTKDQFDPEHAIPGVTCESCHGPGLRHVVAASMNMIEDARALIFTPRPLSPVESVDFCGACHLTSADVVEIKSIRPEQRPFSGLPAGKKPVLGSSRRPAAGLLCLS
jgi:hypothetical protein